MCRDVWHLLFSIENAVVLLLSLVEEMNKIKFSSDRHGADP